MEAKSFSEADLNKIKAFLAKQEFLPVQQSLEWGEFQKKLGNEVFRIGVEENGELIAYTQVFVKKLPFGISWLQIPRAPLVPKTWDMKYATELIDEIKKIGKRKNAVFARFEFQRGVGLQSPQLHEAEEESFPLATLILDLTKSEEEILAQMKPKGRYNIRVAERYEVEVQESKDVGKFYELLKKTTLRDGFFSHHQGYYEKLLETMGEKAKLLIAKKNGKAIAGIIITFAGDTCTYYYGASDHDFRQLMAPYLIQWRAIQLAKKQGMKFYDFLGIALESSTNHRLVGVTGFKRKFGGEVVSYPPPKELALKPLIYRLFKSVKKFR